MVVVATRRLCVVVVVEVDVITLDEPEVGFARCTKMRVTISSLSSRVIPVAPSEAILTLLMDGLSPCLDDGGCCCWCADAMVDEAHVAPVPLAVGAMPAPPLPPPPPGATEGLATGGPCKEGPFVRTPVGSDGGIAVAALDGPMLGDTPLDLDPPVATPAFDSRTLGLRWPPPGAGDCCVEVVALPVGGGRLPPAKALSSCIFRRAASYLSLPLPNVPVAATVGNGGGGCDTGGGGGGGAV